MYGSFHFLYFMCVSFLFLKFRSIFNVSMYLTYLNDFLFFWNRSTVPVQAPVWSRKKIRKDCAGKKSTQLCPYVHFAIRYDLESTYSAVRTVPVLYLIFQWRIFSSKTVDYRPDSIIMPSKCGPFHKSKLLERLRLAIHSP